MTRENENRLLWFVRKRFAALVAFSDAVEQMHDEADRLERAANSEAASKIRLRIKEIWEHQLIASERYRQDFNHLRSRTVYAPFSADEWTEITDLDLTEREIARRLADRASLSCEDR